MTIEQTVSLITISLTIANALMTFYNLYYSRKKDFQDKLFQLKLDAYKELSEACYEATIRLDINSSPFVEMYDITDKAEWLAYCETNMSEPLMEGFRMQKLINKYALVVPKDILTRYDEFTAKCIRFVTMSYHRDTGLIIDNQRELGDLYTDLLNRFRKDLNMNAIDWGLRKRISS